jgi:hypothetical protein
MQMQTMRQQQERRCSCLQRRWKKREQALTWPAHAHGSCASDISQRYYVGWLTGLKERTSRQGPGWYRQFSSKTVSATSCPSAAVCLAWTTGASSRETDRRPRREWVNFGSGYGEERKAPVESDETDAPLSLFLPAQRTMMERGHVAPSCRAAMRKSGSRICYCSAAVAGGTASVAAAAVAAA